MPESVSSGLGRNGPWLQNRWLRVESRQDDGTISPVALAGAFRPTERAAAYVEFAGENPLLFERCDYDLQPHEDALGKGRRLSLVSTLPRQGAALRREVVLYDDHPFLVTRLGVTDRRSQPAPLAVLHAFATRDEGRGRLQLTAAPADWRFYRNGWMSWAPTMSFGGAERDARSGPPIHSPEQAQTEPGRFAADDVGVLYDPTAGRALLAGAVSARDFISQVYADAPARLIDARNLCDAIPIAPGETAWSEWFLVDLVGHPNDQLARYGDALGRMMGARVPEKTPSGWCSWYYFYTTVAEDDVVRNLRFLEQHRRELPVETVQIDDGYQADIGDWLTVNEKFPRGMQWLASEIKRAGYMPGLWLAPFLLAGSSKTFAEHPDFVTRNDDGTPSLAIHNWERQNYGLDATHPGALTWLEDLFRQVCDGWGYDYVKIDFLYGAALAGRRHDPAATRIRAYRAALGAVRRGVGHHRFILGCGSLMAPSVGYFDGNRIGPDCAPFWRFLTREERESPTPKPRGPNDALSSESAMRNTINRWWMHNRLWANDPDCLLVRGDRTKMTLDETRTMATVIGLSGGMLLSSDDLDQLQPDRLDLISLTLPTLPKSAIPMDLMQRDMPERFEAAYDRDFDPVRLVGLFNFDDVTRDLTLELPDGDWHVFELWDERYRGVCSGSLTFDLVAPHAARLVALRPADGRPRLVGATAHVGLGVLDVTAQTFDPVSGELRLALDLAGRRHRRIFVAGGEAASATLGGRAVSVGRSSGAAFVEVDVDTPSELVITFSS
ncbi:MAG: alpha-galactosidase [Chloroflexi bacterium]|nr:alpha-galactosidase [Chloroflexota bacterium]